jgi:hypothetical protein
MAARFEQYEVWALTPGNGTRWEMVAAFQDFDVASAIASRRGRGVRLIQTVYEDGKVVEQHVLAEVGAIRDNP